jgi:hypothetical protein
MERHLLDAFASHDAADAVPSPRMRSVVWRPGSGGKPITLSWRAWVPAVAAVVLVAGAGLVWWMNRPLVVFDYGMAPPTGARKDAPAPIVDKTVDRPAVESQSASVVPPSPRRKSLKKTNVVTPSGFVDLPWTAGLPAFESGEIVRMDVPVASLPAYGIDISSGAGRGPVEADVLIGQDGFARAIRLVTTTSRSAQ